MNISLFSCSSHEPIIDRASGVKLILCGNGKGRRDPSAEHSMRITVGYGDPARGHVRKLLRLAVFRLQFCTCRQRLWLLSMSSRRPWSSRRGERRRLDFRSLPRCNLSGQRVLGKTRNPAQEEPYEESSLYAQIRALMRTGKGPKNKLFLVYFLIFQVTSRALSQQS